MSQRPRLDSIDSFDSFDIILDHLDDIRESPECMTCPFASPEAAAVRKQMVDSSDYLIDSDEYDINNNETDKTDFNDSVYVGIDIPLENHSEEKEHPEQSNTKDDTGTQSNIQSPTRMSSAYWKKLAKSVKSNAKCNGKISHVSKSSKRTSTQISRPAPIPQRPSFQTSKPTPKPQRPSFQTSKPAPTPQRPSYQTSKPTPPVQISASPPSRTRLRRASVCIPIKPSRVENETKNLSKSQSFAQGKFFQTSPVVFSRVDSKPKPKFDTPSPLASSIGDNIEQSELAKIRNRSRFGRRLSLPGQLPLPPVVLGRVSAGRAISNSQEKLSTINDTGTSRQTVADGHAVPLAFQSFGRPSTSHPRSELQKTVSELRQERSLVISNLNSTGSQSNEYIGCENDSPGGMFTRHRLMNRRASNVCSVSEFNKRKESENSFQDVPRKKSASLESLHPERRRPTPVDELTEYFEIQDSKSDEKLMSSINDLKKLSIRETSVSTTHLALVNGESFTGNGIKEPPVNREPNYRPRACHGRRRGSLPSIRDPELTELPQQNYAMTTRVLRSHIEIVEDVEDEIQQLISVRKQQLIENFGGVGHYTKLQDRAKAKTTGGRLKQVLGDMNSNRTTAELLQIALERNAHKSNERK